MVSPSSLSGPPGWNGLALLVCSHGYLSAAPLRLSSRMKHCTGRRFFTSPWINIVQNKREEEWEVLMTGSLCNVLTCDTLRQRSDCNWGVTCDQLCNVGSHHRTVASLPALTQNWGLTKMKGPGGLQRAALLPCNPSQPSCLSPAGHDYISSLRLCLRHAEFTSSSTRCCEVRQSWSVTANISICGAVSLDRCRLDSLTPDNLLSLISLSLSLTRK